MIKEKHPSTFDEYLQQYLNASDHEFCLGVETPFTVSLCVMYCMFLLYKKVSTSNAVMHLMMWIKWLVVVVDIVFVFNNYLCFLHLFPNEGIVVLPTLKIIEIRKSFFFGFYLVLILKRSSSNVNTHLAFVKPENKTFHTSYIIKHDQNRH